MITVDIESNDWKEACKKAAEELSKKIDQQVLWEIMKENLKGWHEFSVPWTSKMRDEDWNEICAWALEQFGLPGERYQTHPDLNEMKFLFRDAKDYEWMVLRWS